MSAADVTLPLGGPAMSRDALLKSAAGAALSVGALGLARGPAARLLAPAAPAASGPLDRAAWSAQAGSRLRIVGSDGTRLSARLDEVRDLAGAPPGSREAFSLVLRGPRGRAFAGGLYTVVHPRLGRHDLFVSPVGRGKKGQDYQIVVNRLTSRPRRPQGGSSNHG